MLKKNTVLLLFVFLFFQSYCQQDLGQGNPIAIKSSIIDTVKISRYSRTIHVLWLNDTLSLRIPKEKLKNDTQKYSRLLNKKTELTQKEKFALFINCPETAVQNCFCYALEKYFEHSKKFKQDIFNSSTHIGEVCLLKVLNNYFVKTSEISTNPKKNLNQPIANNVVLAFKVKSEVIHAVFYSNGIFYSKNGGFKSMQFKSLRKFLKKYYSETDKIIVYKINEDKVNKICANK